MKGASFRKLSDSGLAIGCTKEVIGKGKRLIITDAMTKNGPLTGVLMIFKANKAKKSSRKGRKGKIYRRPSVSTGNEDKNESCADSNVQLEENNNDIVQEEKPLYEDDYHESMNSEKYEKYFFENICYNASAKAIVIDNAPCHSKNSEHYPSLAGENSSTLTG